MGDQNKGKRILFYSHDTFGLGHLRRSRTLAKALVENDPSLSALILTGSPIAGRFDFPDRVDYVRLPGVVKLPDGDYASHNLGMDIEDTVSLRSAIIRATAAEFKPDLLIADKEAGGFRNELLPTLKDLKSKDIPMVLGLRDVLDESATLKEEWRRKNMMQHIEGFYDQIWVYGLNDIHDPLTGLDVPASIENKIHYTGYLRRELPHWPMSSLYNPPSKPYIVVTTGGGGDGADLIDWVLRAYEADGNLDIPSVIVTGPFLPSDKRMEFENRSLKLENRVSIIGFDSRIERLIDEAAGVIGMGGYNTFCEILSLDKPGIIVPRTWPRLEQYIRAAAAEKLDLIKMLHRDRDGNGPKVMANAIKNLENQTRPSKVELPGLLDGLDVIVNLSKKAMAKA